MGTSSGAADLHHPHSSSSPPKMLPPRHNHHHHHQPPPPQHRPSTLQALTLLPASPDSQTESASSRDTWPDTNPKPPSSSSPPPPPPPPPPNVVRRVSPTDRLSLVDLASDSVSTLSDRLSLLPDELLEEPKSELRSLLEGSSSSSSSRDFLQLQRMLLSRRDLTPSSLSSAPRSLLEIFVAISTGIPAFLHPTIYIPSTQLVEVFLHRRCRNITCRSPLPADDCPCDACTSAVGFCNHCMCVVCNTFDFDINTCRWIGCDLCSHWTHTDCAIRDGKIGMGPSSSRAGGGPEMLFKCQACNRTSELLGWVKDVFHYCASGWDKEALARELDIVSRIFRGSEDPRGRKLYLKCEDLIDKMKTGFPESSACKLMLMLFQDLEMESSVSTCTDLEMESPKNSEGDDSGRLIAPHEACSRIAKVVQEALTKMEMVAEEKMRMTKRARQALETCDREFDDKTRELIELKSERQRKKQQVEELESIVRLKQAEAEMFQRKASEARKEAEWLQNIALEKSKKAEQDYTSRYLEARLEEAEKEKQYLFERMRLQESQRTPPLRTNSSAGGDTSQKMMLSRMQDVLQNAYATPPKSEGP